MVVKYILVALFLKEVLSQCPFNRDFGVSNSQSNQIVSLHNNIRNKILQGQVPGQPKGVGLNMLVWDRKLAIEAQKIANKCVFAHSTVHDSRFSVGQNLFMVYGSNLPFGPNWQAAVNGWYEEYKQYRYGDPFSPATGHYTQLVWANTKFLGCGYTTFKRNNRVSKLYVCNYGPAGNVVGQLPYRRASRCRKTC